jgi:hypothetical protein
LPVGGNHELARGQTASGHHFNPGIYTVRMENMHTLLIKGQSDSGLAMTSVEDNAQPAKLGKAVFQRYGNRYFLSEISIAGQSRHIHVVPSKAESQLQIAGNNTAPTAVELALLEGSR